MTSEEKLALRIHSQWLIGCIITIFLLVNAGTIKKVFTEKIENRPVQAFGTVHVNEQFKPNQLFENPELNKPIVSALWNFHSMKECKLQGFILGELGALTYVIYKEDHTKMSHGFHEIEVKLDQNGDHVFIGTTGTAATRFRFSKKDGFMYTIKYKYSKDQDYQEYNDWLKKRNQRRGAVQ